MKPPQRTEAERIAGTLVALAVRCERAADGRDWALDKAIGGAVGWKPQFGPNELAPPYTRSLDVAMQLVPDGWEWSMHNTGSDTFGPFSVSLGDPMRFHDVEARTLPLAICGAALRVRAHLLSQEQTDER